MPRNKRLGAQEVNNFVSVAEYARTRDLEILTALASRIVANGMQVPDGTGNGCLASAADMVRRKVRQHLLQHIAQAIAHDLVRHAP